MKENIESHYLQILIVVLLKPAKISNSGWQTYLKQLISPPSICKIGSVIELLVKPLCSVESELVDRLAVCSLEPEVVDTLPLVSLSFALKVRLLVRDALVALLENSFNLFKLPKFRVGPTKNKLSFLGCQKAVYVSPSFLTSLLATSNFRAGSVLRGAER